MPLLFLKLGVAYCMINDGDWPALESIWTCEMEHVLAKPLP